MCAPLQLDLKGTEPLASLRTTGTSVTGWGQEKALSEEANIWAGPTCCQQEIGTHWIYTVGSARRQQKYSVFRLDVGNFFWGSKSSTCKIRIIDVVYNTSNNELVHTKALVKNCIMLIDSTWDGQWYESHPGPQDGGQTNS